MPTIATFRGRRDRGSPEPWLGPNAPDEPRVIISQRADLAADIKVEVQDSLPTVSAGAVRRAAAPAATGKYRRTPPTTTGQCSPPR